MDVRSGFTAASSPQSLRRPRSNEYDQTQPEAKRARLAAPLTVQNLKEHTRLTNKTMAKKSTVAQSKSGSDQTKSKTTRSSGNGASTNTTTTDPQFGEKLLANNIRHGFHSVQDPLDVDTMIEHLDRARASQSPEPGDFVEFKDQLGGCENEAEVSATFDLLAKPASGGFIYSRDIAWSQVDNQLTEGLSHAKPDRAMSLKIAAYPVHARQALGPALSPCSNGLVAMPHLCIEMKNGTTNFRNAEEQSAYNGALMVNASHTVHKYLERPDSEIYGRTEALTVTYNGHCAGVYANHAIQKESGNVEYHQTQLFLSSASGRFADFKTTRRRIRNAQDWAREHEKRKLDDLIAHEAARREAQELLRLEEAQRAEAYRAAEAEANAAPVSPPVSNVEHGSAAEVTRSHSSPRLARTVKAGIDSNAATAQVTRKRKSATIAVQPL